MPLVFCYYSNESQLYVPLALPPVSYTHLDVYKRQLYHVNENDRKRMLGHSFGNDVTNRVYGHRDLKDLKMEIEKIDKEYFVTLL